MITFAAFVAGVWVGSILTAIAIGMVTVARNDDNARGIS